MIIPDINILIYAHNEADPQHEPAKRWWENAINGTETIGLPWIVIGGFVRLMTHPKILESPMPVSEATEAARLWLGQTSVITLEPGKRFPAIFFDLLNKLGSAGNLTTDAQIASLAIERQATVYSCDFDFARFEGLQWNNPLA